VFGTSVKCATQLSGATAGQRWCPNSGAATVSSFDGTPIDVAVAFPVASGSDNNYPVVGIYHGWGGTKILPSSATAQRWLTKGYAVFSITDRGWPDLEKGAKDKEPAVRAEVCRALSHLSKPKSVEILLALVPDEGHLYWSHGGHIVVSGPVSELLASPDSLTGAYLSGRESIGVPATRRKRDAKREITVKGAAEHNLRDVDVSFPLGCLIAVTGVSGSGKSTLVNDILYRALAQKLYRSSEAPAAHREILGADQIDKVIEIDQAPIGRTPRSNPATYTGVFAPIRDLFAILPESRERGYRPGRFSFNVKGGRCEACQGDGLRRIEMNFLPDVYVMCEVCRGRRYNSETLAVRYKGHSISDVLNLPSSDALKLLENIPQIQQKLATLVEVGLGYVTLGQSATTLSGGEAQRIKLARELSKRQTGRTLYILDEPTTGLHFDDVRKLLDVLQRLVSLGNTVLIIEHHLDVIKQADWLIDLGPEGGESGGRIVAQGPPEQVARTKKSYTGQALARLLHLAPTNGSASVTSSQGRSTAAPLLGKTDPLPPL